MRAIRDISFYLSMHRECNERLLARAGGMKAGDLEISTKREDVRIRTMVNSVRSEVHRMKAFIRLSSLEPSILYGFLKPRHRIGSYVCEHFARRNEGLIVVLGNGSESWISLCRDGRIWREHGRGLGETLETLKVAMRTEDGGKDAPGGDGTDADTLWQAYYDSQYCPERKNMAAYRRHMPRRDQESAGLRLIQDKKNGILEEFL